MKTKLHRAMARGAIRIKSDSRGFTFLEVMIALGILLIGAAGVLSLFSYGLRATTPSKHITAATNIARAKLEEIKSIPLENKNTPFGNIIIMFPGDAAYDVGSASLPEEATWTVSYPDGTMANPLSVSVVVAWQEENGNTKQVELMALVTAP